MYTILVNEDNSLTTSVRERIVQRSKMVDKLHFLMNPVYKNSIDMRPYQCTMEYLLPISREWHMDILTQSKELYKGMIQYTLPFDTNLTKEFGDVEVKLTFTSVEMDASGVIHQYVRKTTSASIRIVQAAAWSEIIPDSSLECIDQRILALQATMNELADLTQILDDTKADNIKYNAENNTLRLTANGEDIGDEVVINTGDGTSTNAIQQILLNDSGELVAVYGDGTEDVVGKVDSNCPGIYVPNLVNDKLTFTLQENASDETIVLDIDPTNEWTNPEDAGTTTYVWESI